MSASGCDSAESSSTTFAVNEEIAAAVEVVSTDDGKEVNLVLHNEDVSELGGRLDEQDEAKCTRKVSFPKDTELVTSYLEPVNPWAEVNPVTSQQLRELYLESCTRHNTEPLEVILKHLTELDLSAEPRTAVLDLQSHHLSHADCETLEEILKRVQYRFISLSACGLDDVSATAIFDMVEYYEATNELDISENFEIKNRGWQSCVNMVKRSQELRVLSAQGTPIGEMNASSLGKALTGSALHTLKLDHCGMTGRPIASLCTALRKTNVLKELWLADNDLNSFDAYNIATLLKTNLYIQFLHISNNIIKDEGVSYLSEAIIEQTKLLKEPLSERNARMDYSELSASLNSLNNNKCLSPSFKRSDKAPFDEVEKAAAAAAAAEKSKIHLLGQNMNNNEADIELKVEPVPERTVEPEATEPEKADEEMNANVVMSSPLNVKSLKEELEGVVEEARATSLPIDIPTINKQAVSKSLDTDSEFEDNKPTLALPTVVGRSFSSESLNSLTSIDSNDSKSSIRITEAKFAKNGTLERQQTITQTDDPIIVPTGLQELILWNNKLTKNSAKSIADMISHTTTLEVLNIGRNNVGNDFIVSTKASLKVNTSLHTLGMQGTHLSCPGVTALAEVIRSNASLHRIDLRDNNIQMDGLQALNDALPSNKSLTQIDLDDAPRRLSDSTVSTAFNHLLGNIKAHCDRNAKPQPVIEKPVEPVEVRSASPLPHHPLIRTTTNSLKRTSRKISLTCQNVPQRVSSSPPAALPSYLSSVTTIKSPPAIHPASVLLSTHLSTSSVKKSSKSKSKCVDSKHRLKSPLPSPIVSPLPSPSRNRFQVSKVAESTKLSPQSAGGSLSTGSSPTFFPNSRFSVTRVTVIQTPTKASLSTGSLQSTQLSDSALSSSVESPDMEVKRYMNDSCSSLDSMDRNNDLNVSMSSTDSFDFILRDIPSVRVEPLHHQEEPANTYRLNDSLSSLDVSASSQESLVVDDAEDTQKISSNEGTLTNSPCDKECASSPARCAGTATNRTRKNSWIPNPIAMAKSDSGSGYPQTLDKLFSIFQNPAQYFQRSSPDTTKEVAVHKESPMGGLFAWATGKKDDEPKVLQTNHQSQVTLSTETTEIPVDDTISQQEKQEVKENISPENTITVNSSIKQSSVVPAAATTAPAPAAPVLEKVIFELGDETEDSDRESSLQGSVAAAMQQVADEPYATAAVSLSPTKFLSCVENVPSQAGVILFK